MPSPYPELASIGANDEAIVFQAGNAMAGPNAEEILRLQNEACWRRSQVEITKHAIDEVMGSLPVAGTDFRQLARFPNQGWIDYPSSPPWPQNSWNDQTHSNTSETVKYTGPIWEDATGQIGMPPRRGFSTDLWINHGSGQLFSDAAISQSPPMPDHGWEIDSFDTHRHNGMLSRLSNCYSTRLSPLAPDYIPPEAWNNEITKGQVYIPTGPLNYWHLLSRPVDCNWHSIVRKVIYDNDRQSSTFLQKLIAGSAKTHDIVDAVITLAYPLMIHSDGNFLVQCCFEYGSLGQIIKMAKVVGENILNLAMDAFGCHVVQKAVDNVPENYKVAMANRLLPHIHDTIIHPYASHVWKKLLTVRWEIPRPHIIEYLNKGLCGMWHKIALNRSGSVLVQTIFENCVEEDKRPCIEELFVNIDIVSHGQFGSWCIEHICEHGTVADRRRAIDHIIRHAVEYSTDRFASKVVRHCLVIGGAEFLNRYVDTVCQNHSAGFRIPLIDIAINQYGSSLIQWILTHSSPVHRELIARHVRKYKVSLHGSRFGTPVSMLCADALASTYPVTGTLARRTRNPRYSVI